MTGLSTEARVRPSVQGERWEMRSEHSKEPGAYRSVMEDVHLPGAVLFVTHGADHRFKRKAPRLQGAEVCVRKPIMPLIAPV